MVDNDQDRFETEVMNELQQQEKSMKTIATAFVKAQKEFAPALKTSTNPHFRSKYVSLDGCIEAVLDALNNNGIALIQQTHDCESGVKIETILVHESGEILSGGILHVPAAKQDPQGYGSALTYARRYSLMATCGIAPEDDDGNLATERAGSVVKKPQTNNEPKKGMVFANGTGVDNWKWAAVKAVAVTEEEKYKFPIPKQPGKFYEYRMDMETLQHFEERDFMDALSYIGILPE